MPDQTADMAELNDRDREVLRILTEGRSNPMLIRDETDLDKGDVNTVLVKLSRDSYTRRVARGLYEITDKGREEIGAETTLDAVRKDLERALETREWGAVEDAAARVGVTNA